MYQPLSNHYYTAIQIIRELICKENTGIEYSKTLFNMFQNLADPSVRFSVWFDFVLFLLRCDLALTSDILFY